jgi:phosphatidylglycerophosphate synthase
MNILKTFFKQFSLLTIIILVLSILVDFFVPKIPISPTYPIIIIFLYLITLGVFRLIAKSMENRISQFANTYMLVNFGKMFFYTIIILLYSLLNKEDAISFMLTFFTYYFIFTSFEIVSLLSNKK